MTSACGLPGKTGDKQTLRKDERKENMKYKMELNLFDGDAGAPDGAPDAQASPEAADAQPQNQATGEEDGAAEEMKAAEVIADKSAEFEELIKGKYKEEFDRRIQNNLKRRFKESSALKEKNIQNEKIIEMLKMKYGITGDDIGGLRDAITNDDGFIKEEAEKRGIDTDTLKHLKRLEFENESIKRQMMQQQSDIKMENTLRSWLEESARISEKYPDFDMETEAENPEFLRLLQAGISLRDAYLTVHHDEIVDSLVNKAADDARKQTTDAIRARNSRPAENGMSRKSTALFTKDVSKLTPSERAEIARRVARGEQISF